MFSLFSVCLWSVRDLEGNRGMSAQKECSGPQWPAAVLHSSSATSTISRKDFETLVERNKDQMVLPIFYNHYFSDDTYSMCNV